MPATAGRVRMPSDNRLSVSDSLKTSEIWQKSVGYDPYSPRVPNEAQQPSIKTAMTTESKSLFALARLTGSSLGATPGACKKCGQVGHLAYQCRNNITLSSIKDLASPTPFNPSTTLSDEDDSTSSHSSSESPPKKKKSKKRSHHHHRHHHRVGRKDKERTALLSRSLSPHHHHHHHRGHSKYSPSSKHRHSSRNT